MSQTTYTRDLDAAFPGQLGDSGEHRIEGWLNASGADIPAGILVEIKGEGEAQQMSGSSTHLAGAVLNTFARNPGDNAGLLSGSDAIKDGGHMNVLSEGAVWLLAEEAMAVDDDVYVRHSASGSEVLGAVRNDADTADARQVKGARVLKACSGAGPVLVYLSVSVDTSHI